MGIFLLYISLINAYALVPLEGIVYGDISDIKQYDPLRGLFNNSIVYENKSINEAQREKIEKYKSLHDQAINLKNSCEVERFYTYETVWSEALAKRAVAANLQYIGLDLTTKAIAKYAKNFNLSNNEFENLTKNLVENNCSKNISVFSKKLLKNNFKELYEKDEIDFSFPSLDESPYFTQNIINITNSRKNKRKEFNYAIKNFQAFCSWGGDTENYRLLPPYLKNPILMSYVFNHMLKRELQWDKEEAKTFLVQSKNTAQVACEDLICRRRNYAGFNKLFPRMVGSGGVEDDLKILYCNHFQDLTYKTRGLPLKLRSWINDKEISESIIEPMNIISFITGVPDLFVGADNFKEIEAAFNKTIEYRWDEWAKNKSEQLITDLLYEESLYVDLVSKYSREGSRVGEFQLTFDFTLGELDRVLQSSDKISSTFNLTFPKSYLKWVRESYISANNKSKFDQMDVIEENFAKYIEIQLEQKKKYFTTALWNRDFKKIIAKDLVKQLSDYNGNYFKGFDKNQVNIPVKFRFGLFALRYIREKYKSTLSSRTLTFKKEMPSYTK